MGERQNLCPSEARFKRSSWKWRPAAVVFLFLAPLLLLTLEIAIDQRLKTWMNLASSILSADQVSSHENASDSCLSRWQHDFLRNASFVHSLPSGLSRALAAYEKMHTMCYHRRRLRDAFSHPDPEEPCKYLVYLEDGEFGLGNRILSLISAFVYSLLTSRMFLVDSRGHLSKLLCEPFTNSSWLLPHDFPYDALHRAPMLGDALQQDFKFSNVVHLELLHEQSWGDQQFFCPQTHLELEKAPWIAWSSNQYYIPRFFTFPKFWRRLVWLFPDVSLVFTHLSRYLLLPKNAVWDRILRIYSSYLSSPGKKLGVQIRLHSRSDRAGFDLPTHDRILQCLIGNGLLPNVSSSSNLRAGMRDKLARKIHREEFQTTTKVFVTSLQARYHEELKKTYMNHPAVDGSLVQVQTVSHDGFESLSHEQAADAFAEMWLLSFTDQLVTSSWSTFGYVASGLAGLRPYLLNIKGDFQNDGLPPCSLAQSIEPCNHFPFNPECHKNLTSDLEHEKWLKAHIRRCQCEPNGIQLISGSAD